MNDNTNRIISNPHFSAYTVVASHLAFIQLILDGTEAGIPWYLVGDKKTICMLEATFGKRFCTPWTSAPVE